MIKYRGQKVSYEIPVPTGEDAPERVTVAVSLDGVLTYIYDSEHMIDWPYADGEEVRISGSLTVEWVVPLDSEAKTECFFVVGSVELTEPYTSDVFSISTNDYKRLKQLVTWTVMPDEGTDPPDRPLVYVSLDGVLVPILNAQGEAEWTWTYTDVGNVRVWDDLVVSWRIPVDTGAITQAYFIVSSPELTAPYLSHEFSIVDEVFVSRKRSSSLNLGLSLSL